jgi:hypothetical protein
VKKYLKTWPHYISGTLTKTQNDMINRFCMEHDITKTALVRAALTAYFQRPFLPKWPETPDGSEGKTLDNGV